MNKCKEQSILTYNTNGWGEADADKLNGYIKTFSYSTTWADQVIWADREGKIYFNILYEWGDAGAYKINGNTKSRSLIILMSFV